MDKKILKRTVVPMNKHSEGLHAGHIKLLEVANSIGDRVVVPMLFNTVSWYNYLIHGSIPVMRSTQDIDITQQIYDLKIHNVIPVIMPFYEIPEEKRIEWQRKAKDILKLFQSQIPEFMYSYLYGTTIELCRQIERSHGNVKFMVKGPELRSFFIKAVKPLLGSPVKVIISDKIEKDLKTNIKLQSNISKVDAEFKPIVDRLPYIIGNIKENIKVGDNKELVRELNDAYNAHQWKIIGISRLEDGIIPGQLDTIQFMFPCNQWGTINVEDVTFRSK